MLIVFDILNPACRNMFVVIVVVWRSNRNTVEVPLWHLPFANSRRQLRTRCVSNQNSLFLNHEPFRMYGIYPLLRPR